MSQYQASIFLALRKEKAKVLRDLRSGNVLEVYTNIKYTITGQWIEAALLKMYKDVMSKEASSLYNSLFKTKSFGSAIDWIADVEAFIRQYILENVVRQITQTTINEISAILQQIIINAGSYDEAVRAIMATTEMDRVRARLITRTEVNKGMNAGHEIAAKKLPFKCTKTWIAARDNRTRGAEGDDKADHYHMNLIEIDEDELFTDTRSGALMLYPGDTSNGAQAKDVCNCRCSVVFTGKRDANGRLIMR